MARTMIGLLGMLALSVGCASTSQERSAARPGGDTTLKAQQGTNPESNVVCTVETPTGSRIAQRICRTQERSTLEQRLVQDLTHSPRASPPLK